MRLAVVMSTVVAGLVAAAVWAAGRPESTLERIRRTGVARVAYSQEAPFAYRAADGRVTGESAEIGRTILGELGIRRVEWVLTEFGTLLPALAAGHVDLIATGMFITRARSQEVAFSVPTYTTRPALLVRAADESRFTSYAALRESGARLAIIAGAYERRLAAAANIPQDRVRVVPDVRTGVAALRSGDVDAMAITLPSAEQLEQSLGDLRAQALRDSMVGSVPAVGYGAFGFRPEDEDFRKAFDERLRRFLGTPRHRELVRRFGFSAEELDLDGARPR
jgi:polar amino acid transport system substrate-binding protein